METEKKPLIILTGPYRRWKNRLVDRIGKSRKRSSDLSGFHAGLPLHGHRFGKNQQKRNAGRTSLSGR